MLHRNMNAAAWSLPVINLGTETALDAATRTPHVSRSGTPPQCVTRPLRHDGQLGKIMKIMTPPIRPPRAVCAKLFSANGADQEER